MCKEIGYATCFHGIRSSYEVTSEPFMTNIVAYFCLPMGIYFLQKKCNYNVHFSYIERERLRTGEGSSNF